MMRALSIVLLGAALGCGTSETEQSPPTTPSTADRDGDYLNDTEEGAHGTDPANPDSDGDTYLDGDEVLEQKDPLDPESRIYVGRWPYQRLKDDIVDPGFDSSAAIGSVMPRLIATDQFGESVDLYDFALHGRRVVIDLSALWCGPCRDMAAWLGGEPSTFDMQPELAPIPELVVSGEIYWITVVFEDNAGAAAGPDDASAWAAAFPNEHIAVLADNDRALYDFLFPGAMPSIQVLDEDMTLRVYDRYDYMAALQSLLE
jgi:hypothetical protein